MREQKSLMGEVAGSGQALLRAAVMLLGVGFKM